MPLDQQLRDIPNIPLERPLLIVSDLDGTLLDHETYSYAPAIPALERIKETGFPLILASSKTAAEIVPLREELGFGHCEAIVENGAGVLQPGNEIEPDDSPYHDLLSKLDKLPKALRRQYTGFSQLSIDQVADMTGLTTKQASLAKRRCYSEPGIWDGDDHQFEELCTAVADIGLTQQRGGRFITLSFGWSKQDRISEIAEKYSDHQRKAFVVALGDAPNDIEMLTAADLGIVIPNPANEGIAQKIQSACEKIVCAPEKGPSGWNQSILAILENR
ncbi:MAG: HAD-IIB family hydrolase [Pseudomonadota bacterium]